MDQKQIIKGIEERKYKYTYTDDRLDDTELMMEANSVDLTNCFVTEEDSVYNIMRTGLLEERTPQPGQKLRKVDKSHK